MSKKLKGSRRSKTNPAKMVSLELLGTAASVVAVILIIYTYGWNQIKDEHIVEERLRGRLIDTPILGSDPSFEITQIRCWESNNLSDRFVKHLLFQRVGECEFEVAIKVPNSKYEVEFDEQRFHDDLSEYGDSGDVNFIGHASNRPYYIFRVVLYSLDPEDCYLVMKEINDYLTIHPPE